MSRRVTRSKPAKPKPKVKSKPAKPRPAATAYHPDLLPAIRRFLPRDLSSLPGDDARARWVPRLLVVTALLMAWHAARHLTDRFAAARRVVVAMFPGRRRPGRTPEGFLRALAAASDALLAALAAHWRAAARTVAGPHWLGDGGWLLFAVDGTKVDCPRTRDNEDAFGTNGKAGAGPQLLLTSLFHLGTGLPWAFRRSGIKGHSERGHLADLLPLLPGGAMLVADAGFTGYDLLRSVLAGGREFLIRVGGNVRLLRKLGYQVRERKQTVYLWPAAKQGRRGRHGRRAPAALDRVSPPLALRLIVLVDGRGRRTCLLTSVRDPGRLSDAAARRIYARRWGVEVAWRGLKQTLGRGDVRGASADHAGVELDWAVAGFWLLGLLAVSRLVEAGRAPADGSVAGALRVLRDAMTARVGRRAGLEAALAGALKDGYRRPRGAKAARHYPHKRRQRPPGAPKARTATRAEVRLAQRVREHERAKSVAA